MMSSSIAEIISIGAVLPFIAMLTAPDKVFNHELIQPLVQFLGIVQPDELMLPLTVIFCSGTVLAGAMRILLLYSNTRLSYAAGADLSIDIYRRTLYQSYSVHVKRNSSEVINAIIVKTGVLIRDTLMPILTIVSSLMILCAISFSLLFIDPYIALAAFGSFGVIYGCIVFITRQRLKKNSISVAKQSDLTMKSLQEGLGGVRDILLDASQETFCKMFRHADLALRKAQGSNLIMAGSPRYAMEAVGMILISVLAYSMAKKPGGAVEALPILGALALSAQRLLPVLQQIYASITSIKGSQASLQDTLAMLDQKMQPSTVTSPLDFKRKIHINNMSFRYDDNTPWVVKNLSLQIPRGKKFGFIGTTGSGKSTLLDIVMGLLEPTEGELLIDGVAVNNANARGWHAHIAHVPQTVFLADSSIAENIAFGCPKNKIDLDRVKEAASQAQISEVIESLPEKYDTFVGERGVRLSGGQRQRIGIARALYKDADVLIFDEATSALDTETENAVMQTIDALSNEFTILIIAHRLSTLRCCNQIVELKNGNISAIGSYEGLIGQNNDLVAVT
ncbi:ABC transporter ATP-binding protein/permease [Litoricola sp.]|nr:ABC transporter ATP-binding protein/permease [Litorivicinus sp.]